MLPFPTLIKTDRKSRIAVYKQVATGITENIQKGIIKPGTSLPSSRELATMLHLHRNTIIAAYDELSSQDWIKILPRKGVVVADDLPVIKPRTFKAPEKNPGYREDAHFQFEHIAPGLGPKTTARSAAPIVINDGFTDLRLAPMDAIMREYHHQFKEQGLQTGTKPKDFSGTPNLKEATKKFLNDTRGLNISTENLIITRGAQMAIYLAASLMIKPGDKVMVSTPNYLVADSLFTTLGATLIRIPVDEKGMIIDAVEQVLKKEKVRFLYITPHHHHPTTVTLSASRRVQLLQLINSYHLPVIEDDYDYDFHYKNSPILPLASSNHHGNVIYIGSFTKLIAPSFRVGYMVAPGNFISGATNLKCLIDFGGDPLMEEVISRLLTSGEITRHLKKLNKIYAKRCDLLCSLLKSRLSRVLSFSKPNGGMALWVTFNKNYPLAVVIPKLAAAGLIFSSSLYPDFEHQQGNSVRIGFASLNEKEITEAVGLLETLLS